jgi:hypothetical protein
VDPNQRRIAGVVGGDLTVHSLVLSDPAVATAQWPRMRLGAAGRTDLSGALSIAGDLTAGGTLRGALPDNSVAETKLDKDTRAKLVSNGNAHDHTGGDGAAIRHSIVVKDDGRNPHGTTGSDLGDASINEIKFDPATRAKLVTNGSAHDHSGGDGGPIKHSLVLKDDGRNPHGTTAADIGALPTAGGTVTGKLSATNVLNVWTSVGTNNPAVWVWHGNPTAIWGLVSAVTPNLTSWSGAHGAAVAAVSDIANIYGVYARAPAGTIALWVEGTSQFTGAKTGYVADVFVNRSGQRLRTGDIVKLKGTPAVRFQGDDNKIPVSEVTLADKENDPMTIGIVDREAIPHPDHPDTRVGPEDPTYIEDGGELYVVTLGTYAHCKVDSSEAPIQVGDLLTSSANPGYARKAVNPQVGSIIGKALEPLQQGTGYIAVFVNIQ